MQLETFKDWAVDLASSLCLYKEALGAHIVKEPLQGTPLSEPFKEPLPVAAVFFQCPSTFWGFW